MFSKYNCTICYENEVNVCFIPCGHTFCKGCGEKANRKCFICNGTVDATKPIYLIEDSNQATVADPLAYDTGSDPVAYGPDIGPAPVMSSYQSMLNFMR